jgi:hypothetical protein
MQHDFSLQKPVTAFANTQTTDKGLLNLIVIDGPSPEVWPQADFVVFEFRIFVAR